MEEVRVVANLAVVGRFTDEVALALEALPQIASGGMGLIDAGCTFLRSLAGEELPAARVVNEQEVEGLRRRGSRKSP